MKSNYSEDHLRQPLTDSVNTMKKHALKGTQHESEQNIGQKIASVLGEVMFQGNLGFLYGIYVMSINLLAHFICLLMHKKLGVRFFSIPLVIISYYLVSIYGAIVGVAGSFLGFGHEYYWYHIASQVMLIMAVITFIRIQLHRHFGFGKEKHHIYSYSVGESWFYKPYQEFAAKTRLPELSSDGFIKYIEAPAIIILGFGLSVITGIGFFRFIGLCGLSLYAVMNKRDRAFEDVVLDGKDASLINSVMADVMKQDGPSFAKQRHHGVLVNKATINDLKATFEPIEDQFTEDIEALKREQSLGDEESPKSA